MVSYNNLKRIDWIDAAKGLLILLVVVGHNIQFGSGSLMLENKDYFNNAVFQFIYSCHMPAFALLAGYLMKFSVDLDRFIIKKLRSVLVPAVAWSMSVSFYLICLSLYYGSFSQAVVTDAIVKLLTYLWFLRAYMFSAAVIWFVHRYLKDSVAAYLAVLAVLLVLPDWLNTETWKFTYVFFVSGYLWNVHQVPKRISNFQKHKIITSVILALLFIVLFQFYNADSFVYTTGMTIRSVEQTGTDLYRFLIGFIGSGMVLWLVYITYDRIPETVKRAFLYLGRISLSIYITDVIITDFFMPGLTYGFHLNYAVVLAQTVIMLAVCIAADYLIGRIPVARRLLLGGR
ncbi:MAG: acyltransferase family protein [Saccharofermentans sp.]|nr:acyltransferase family protein [Saccharofermentans sp.]